MCTANLLHFCSPCLNFHSVCAFCLKTSFKSKNPNFLLFLLFCCHPFAFLLQLCPLLFVVCHWSRREGDIFLTINDQLRPSYNQLNGQPFFKVPLGGFGGCFLRLVLKNTFINLEKHYSKFSGFSRIANSSAQLLPEGPKGFQIGSSAEAGQPAARAKPCVSNTDLQNISPTQRTDRQ